MWCDEEGSATLEITKQETARLSKFSFLVENGKARVWGFGELRSKWHDRNDIGAGGGGRLKGCDRFCQFDGVELRVGLGARRVLALAGLTGGREGRLPDLIVFGALTHRPR